MIFNEKVRDFVLAWNGGNGMKTNLSNLMNLVAEYERNFNSISYTMIEHVYSTTIEELDGRKNIIEDYKKDFEDELSEYNMLLTKI